MIYPFVIGFVAGAGNDRRRLTRAERRADDAGTVMMLGCIAAAWGCAAFVAGVVVALAGIGVRTCLP